jgi:hypothetical protein
MMSIWKAGADEKYGKGDNALTTDNLSMITWRNRHDISVCNIGK